MYSSPPQAATVRLVDGGIYSERKGIRGSAKSEPKNRFAAGIQSSLSDQGNYPLQPASSVWTGFPVLGPQLQPKEG